MSKKMYIFHGNFYLRIKRLRLNLFHYNWGSVIFIIIPTYSMYYGNQRRKKGNSWARWHKKGWYEWGLVWWREIWCRFPEEKGENFSYSEKKEEEKKTSHKMDICLCCHFFSLSLTKLEPDSMKKYSTTIGTLPFCHLCWGLCTPRSPFLPAATTTLVLVLLINNGGSLRSISS